MLQSGNATLKFISTIAQSCIERKHIAMCLDPSVLTLDLLFPSDIMLEYRHVSKCQAFCCSWLTYTCTLQALQNDSPHSESRNQP